jgi:ketosteroid isomerase-like protein
MSSANVDLHVRAMAAFNARDVDAIVAFFDPNIEYHSTFAAADGVVYHGHDGIRSWHRNLRDAWGEDIRVEVEAYFDLGEETLAFTVWHARGRRSGAEVALQGALMFRWRDGRAAYGKGYVDRDQALAELGITEDELEPIAP